MASSPRILIFSRGRGYGHAIPDMALASSLVEIDPAVDLHFVSYGAGAKAIRERGWPLFDLNLPEDNPFFPTYFESCKLIESERPNLVISHEEFAAVAAAAQCKVPAPSVFLSAWLPKPRTLASECLTYANIIYVLSSPGLFSIPPGLPPPRFVGALLRPLNYTREDRKLLRSSFKIPDDAYLVTVVPGGASSDKDYPLFGRIIRAFKSLHVDPKILAWVSSSDFHHAREFSLHTPWLQAYEYIDPIERILAASDLVITKGTRGITIDCAILGVPSLSISPENNPIDDLLVPRILSNISLISSAVTDQVLGHYLTSFSADSRRMQAAPSPEGTSVEFLARSIYNDIKALQI